MSRMAGRISPTVSTARQVPRNHDGVRLCSTVWSISSNSGFQKPFGLRNTIGLRCSSSRRQDISSMISSRVPMPPGRMAKASACSNMICLRSCIDGTTRVSTSSISISRLTRNAGMTPSTLPPARWQPRAVAPISPTPPPP